MRLNNKVALVTGAAQGIGEAIARRFVEQGAYVYITDIQDEKGKVLAKLLGDKAQYCHLDVRDEAQWEAVLKKINDTRGGLDILVNNAGIAGFLETPGPHDPEHLDKASWDAVMATNLDGVILGCKHGIAAMKSRQSASIVNVSSRSGLVGIPGAAAYAASKAGVRNHTKSVALYCAQQAYSIRCNSIHPGVIYTPMWDAMLGAGEQREAAIASVASEVPLRRMGTADDVAYAAVYLASDESSYVTGIELNIDGGILAGSSAAPGQ